MPNKLRKCYNVRCIQSSLKLVKQNLDSKTSNIYKLVKNVREREARPICYPIPRDNFENFRDFLRNSLKFQKFEMRTSFWSFYYLFCCFQNECIFSRNSIFWNLVLPRTSSSRSLQDMCLQGTSPMELYERVISRTSSMIWSSWNMHSQTLQY